MCPLALTALLVGCSGPGPVAPPPPATSSAAPTPLPAAASGPRLPPLTFTPEPPACVRAEALTSRAPGLLSAGKLSRTLRVLEEAASLCPATERDARPHRLAALDGLGLATEVEALGTQMLADPQLPTADRRATEEAVARVGAGYPAADPERLVEEGLAHRRAGRHVEAQRTLDRALVALAAGGARVRAERLATGCGVAPALSEDARVAATVFGTRITVLRADSLTPWRVLETTTETTQIALSADGARLAMVVGGEAELWSVGDARREHRLGWSGEAVAALALSADGRRLATAGSAFPDATARVWDTASGDSLVAVRAERTGDATAVALAPDGAHLALGTDRGFVQLWRIDKPTAPALVSELRTGTRFSRVQALRFSPAGDHLAAVVDGEGVESWSVPGGTAGIQQKTGRRGEAALAFGADGRLRIFGQGGRSSFDHALSDWNVATSAEVRNREVAGERGALALDARRLLTCSGTHELTLIDAETGETLTARHGSSVEVAELSTSHRRALVSRHGSEHALRLWSNGDLSTVQTDAEARALAFSTDGDELAVAVSGELRRFDARGQPRPPFPRPPDLDDVLGYSWDGRLLVVDDFPDLAVYGLEIGGNWTTLFDRDVDATYTEISPLGDVIAVRDHRGPLRLVHLPSRSVRPLPSLTDVDTMSFSGDGQVLAVVSDDRLLRLSPETGQPTRPAVATGCSTHSAASFDGRVVAVSCRDQRIEVVAGQVVVRVAVPSTAKLTALALMPHGDRLVTGQSDGAIRFFDAITSAPLGALYVVAGADAAWLETPDGGIELLGAARHEAAAQLTCVVGTVALPFAACAEHLDRLGALGRLLRGEPLAL